MKNSVNSTHSSLFKLPFFAAAVCGLLAIAAGCNINQIASQGDGGGGGGGGGDGGSLGNGDLGNLPAYCSGSGPPISVSDASGTAPKCTGNVAATVFRYGLCVCNSLSANVPFAVDAFDSSQGGVMTLGTGGSVGVIGSANLSDAAIGGTLQVANSVVINQSLSTGADLLTGSGLNSSGPVTVGRNAQINGDIVVNGGLFKVQGTLTYPANRTLTAAQTDIMKTARAAVNVGAPCDCAPELIYNIASYVDARRTDNDNTMGGIDAMQLANYAGDQNLTLNCGRFYLDRIGGSGKINLQVTGRTALFVGGDVNLSNGLTVSLGPSGELDLFIKGGLVSSALLVLGNQTTPAKVRLYMGGNGNINLSGDTVIGGNIYAPQAALVPSGRLEVYGSIFVSSFNPSASVKIHHDVAILNAADACNKKTTGGGTPPACQRCQDCGGQACKNATCGACTSDADCCAPLSCTIQGNCVYIIG